MTTKALVLAAALVGTTALTPAGATASERETSFIEGGAFLVAQSGPLEALWSSISSRDWSSTDREYDEGDNYGSWADSDDDEDDYDDDDDYDDEDDDYDDSDDDYDDDEDDNYDDD